MVLVKKIQFYLSSEVKSEITDNALDMIEIEYIKNLQQQVYFLELECNYLRQQLKTNGVQAELKYDRENTSLKDKMNEIEFEKNNLEKTLIEQSLLNKNSLQQLEEARSMRFFFFHYK
jgi:SMC interacting uncharacterized protein involved in chromosome segregation